MLLIILPSFVLMKFFKLNIPKELKENCIFCMNVQYSPPKSVRLIRSVSVWKMTRIFHLIVFIELWKFMNLLIQWKIYSEMFSKIFIIVNFNAFLFLFQICDFLSVVQFYWLKLQQLVSIYSILCICWGETFC